MTVRRRRRWPWVIGCVALVGVVGFALRSRASSAPKLDPALVIEARRGPLAVDVFETGRVRPHDKIELKSKIAGQVQKVLVREGERVAKGQVLLVLDPTDPSRDVARAAASVAQADNALALAKWTLGYKAKGAAAGVMPPSDVDVASFDIKGKDAALKNAQVALRAANDVLTYTKIVAPIDGVVIERNIEPGEVVTPGVQSTFDGKSLLTVADLGSLLVKVELNQIDVAKVSLGQRATLSLDALPGRTYESTVTKIAPASVKSTGKDKDIDVFPVEVTFDVVDERVKPGMTADVRIHLEAKPDVVSLPIEAVVKETGKSFVTRVVGAGKEQRTEKVEVALGARNDRDVEVISGLDAGSKVVLSPPSAAANESKL